MLEPSKETEVDPRSSFGRSVRRGIGLLTKLSGGEEEEEEEEEKSHEVERNGRKDRERPVFLYHEKCPSHAFSPNEILGIQPTPKGPSRLNETDQPRVIRRLY